MVWYKEVYTQFADRVHRIIPSALVTQVETLLENIHTVSEARPQLLTLITNCLEHNVTKEVKDRLKVVSLKSVHWVCKTEWIPKVDECISMSLDGEVTATIQPNVSGTKSKINLYCFHVLL
jgi:hypothetical protein